MPATKKRILIVEDEGIVAADLTQILEKNGYEVVGVATNAAEAVKAAHDVALDAILMDVHFEGDDLDGIDAARAILALRPAPVVFLTGRADAETIRRVAELGALPYLIKPVQGAELARSLESAISDSALRKSQGMSDPAHRRSFPGKP